LSLTLHVARKRWRAHQGRGPWPATRSGPGGEGVNGYRSRHPDLMEAASPPRRPAAVEINGSRHGGRGQIPKDHYSDASSSLTP